MELDLNKMLIDVMNDLSTDHQDMLMTLLHSGVIVPGDSVEKALIKIDRSGNEYFSDVMDDIMGDIVGRQHDMPEVTIVSRDEPAAHGSLDVFGLYKPQEVSNAPEMTGTSLQELMDSADEEDAVELEWLISKHFMKPSSDVTELTIKLNTLLNPQMDGMGGQQDISVSDIDFDELSNTPVGNLMPHQVHEHNKTVNSVFGLKLIEKLLGNQKNPVKQKFVDFLHGLKDSHDDELIGIVESGFKLIHKNINS